MTDIDESEVYVTIITDTQGTNLVLANMTSMSQVNQASYTLQNSSPTPWQEIMDMITTLMKGSSTVGNIFSTDIPMEQVFSYAGI